MANNAIATIQQTIETIRPRFEAVLVDKSISFERETGFAQQILSSNEFAMKTALQNPQSLVSAVTNIAAIGISLNPARKLAYLVPRDGKICLDISYMGLIDIAVESGSVAWAQSMLVHEADTFIRNGIDKQPTHKFDTFASQKTRGPVVGAYAVAKLSNGDYLTETMGIDEINAIRDRSSAWKAFMRKDVKTCPWDADPGEMQRKTVIKRAHKYWPKTKRLDQAIHYLNTEGGEGLESIGNVIDMPPPPVPDQSVALLESAREAAGKGRAEFAAWWKRATPAQREAMRSQITDLQRRCTKADEARTLDGDAGDFVRDMERAESRMRGAA